MKKNYYDAVIIGGGAVGVQLTLSYLKHNPNSNVLVIESNQIGDPSSTRGSFGRMHTSGYHYLRSLKVGKQIINESMKGYKYGKLGRMMGHHANDLTMYLEARDPKAFSLNALEKNLDISDQYYTEASHRYNVYPQGKVTRSYRVNHPKLLTNQIYAAYSAKESTIDTHAAMLSFRKSLSSDKRVTVLEQTAAEINKDTGLITLISTVTNKYTKYQKLSRNDYTVLFCCAGAYNDKLCGQKRHYIRQKIVFSYPYDYKKENMSPHDPANPYNSLFVGHFGSNKCCVTKYKDHYLFTTELFTRHVNEPKKIIRAASLKLEKLNPLLNTLTHLPDEERKLYAPLIKALKSAKKIGLKKSLIEVLPGYVYTPDKNIPNNDAHNDVCERISANKKISIISGNIQGIRLDINKLIDIPKTCDDACNLSDAYFMNIPVDKLKRATTVPLHCHRRPNNKYEQLNQNFMVNDSSSIFSNSRTNSSYNNYDTTEDSSSSNEYDNSNSSNAAYDTSSSSMMYYREPPRKKRKIVPRNLTCCTGILFKNSHNCYSKSKTRCIILHTRHNAAHHKKPF